MNNENDEIQISGNLKFLESLDLGYPLKNIKEESKEDNFENEINILLAKLNNQIELKKNQK